MNKYDPLRDHLMKQSRDEIILSFDEIEEILGFALPRAAQRAEWWFDDTPEHPKLQRQAVREAGRDARRLSTGKAVRFRKAPATRR